MSVTESVKFRLTRLLKSCGDAAKEWMATINESPVLVLGNQKSGTTAVAVLYAERTGQTVTWDLTVGHNILLTEICNDKTPLEELIDEEMLAFSHDVIKDPNLTFLFDRLKERFPRARFVMIVRDPRDNIRSILDRLDLSGNQERLSSDQLARFPDGWRRLLDGADFGIDEDTYIDCLAERWRRIAHTYLENESDFELIRYEDFLAGKVDAIDDLTSRLGCPRENSIEDHVDQQFQPRGKHREVDWLVFFGERNLKRIEERCIEPMSVLGVR